MRFGFSLLIFFSYLNVSAQQYGFINYSVEDGLAQSQINSIAQDNKGYLWFATNGGISRFDGRTFVNYYIGDGLLDNHVYSIFIDRNEKIWLATLGGINMIDGKKISFFKFEDSYKGFYVKSIAQDLQGNLWLGTSGGGLAFFDVEKKEFKYYGTEDGLSDNMVRSVCSDGKGKVWIGTENGLCVYENGKINISSLLDSHITVSSLFVKKETLWITTFGNGVYRLKNNTLDHFEIVNGLVDSWIKSVFVDENENAWFSSVAGLCKFDGAKFKQFQRMQGLDYENINVAYQDFEGSIWLGTEGGGVYRFCGEDLLTYTTDNGLKTNFVMSIAQNADGELWLGTFGEGIARKSENYFVSYELPEGIKQNYVYSTSFDNMGNLILGTGNGIRKFDGITFKPYLINEDLGNKTVICFLNDTKGRTWIGSSKGLACFSGEKNLPVDPPKRLVAATILKIFEDKNSTIWFASEEGIFSYDGISFHDHKFSSKNKVGSVLNVAEDSFNNLWFGTSDGLLFFDRKTFKTIMLSDNFSSNQIVSLDIDEDNVLWAATFNGIYHFDVLNYVKNKTLLLKHIGRQQGLKSIECNQNAIFDDKKGNIYFGTTAGLVQIIKEKKSAKDIELPKLNLTGIRLFLQETDWFPFSDSIDKVSHLPIGLSIDYKKNDLTFDFIGITYSNPENIRYRYKLVGNDQDWYPLTKETYARYTNLPYGDYTFMVALADEGGELFPIDPVEFHFVITPPYWKTWWFTLISFFLFFLAGWLVYRWRSSVIRKKAEAQQLVYKSKLLALEQETLNASMNRHFIFNALNSIQYYINRQDKLSANKYLTSFAKLIRKNLDSSQNNLVTLSEELERLELYLSLEHMRFSKFSYSIKIGAGVEAEVLKIPPMILQPYIENSIWHGILPMEQPGEILVEINLYKDNCIIFNIEDNGIGIDESLKKKQQFPTEHDSKGMKITETRINLLKKMSGGNIEIKGPYDIKNEGKGTGTRVEIILPIKK